MVRAVRQAIPGFFGCGAACCCSTLGRAWENKAGSLNRGSFGESVRYLVEPAQAWDSTANHFGLFGIEVMNGWVLGLA